MIGFGPESLVNQSEIPDPVTDAPVSDRPIPSIGLGPLRPAPAGLPDPDIAPPTIAESGDPFTAVRVIDLLARLERGRPVRLADIVDRLNATYLDWLFPAPVVADVVLQLQAELDGRLPQQLAASCVEDGPYGPTLTIEDSSRVDPWIVRQAQREAAVVYRAARRVQPPRPTAVRRLTRAADDPERRSSACPPGTRASKQEGTRPMSDTGYATDDALVDATWAQAHLDDPNVRFVEVDVDTTAYEQSHIPGAVGWNWTSQLADGIRRDIAVARGLQRAAVRRRASARTRRSSSTATTTTGSPRGRTGSSSCTATSDVRILNGGRKYWLDNGLPLTVDVPDLRRDRLPAARARLRAARLPRRHPAAPRRRGPGAGRRPLPGRVQRRDHRASGHERDRPAGRPHPGRRVDPVGPDRRARTARSRPAEELRALYEAKGVTPDKDVIAYCRIGERSSHSWFVLHELLGYKRVRNYDGSWTEYGSLIGVPIEKPAPVAVS